AAGTVEEILVDVDETVEVNTVLCTIGDGAPAGEKLPQDEPKGEAKSAAGTTRTTAVETTAVEDLTETHPVTRDIEAARMHSGRVHGVVPLARKLAKEHGVDLTQLTGTGNQGRIV